MASSDSPLKAVIFDCDGVLVDTEPLHYRAFQDVLVPLGLGHDYEYYLRYYIGFDDRDAFREAFREGGRPLDPDMLAQLIHRKGFALQRIASEGINTFPGVISLIEDLSASGVPLGIASGALRHEVEMFATALGIRDAFSVIVSADDVTRSKPDPETYIKALSFMSESLGLSRLDPGSCVAIEDTPAGIESAKLAGVYIIGVAHSYPSSQLRGIADYVVESLTDLSARKIIELIGHRGG